MLFKNLLEVFWLYVVYFTVLFISSFFSSKTKVVGSNVSLFAYIVVSKPLSLLSLDSFSLSFILIPCSQRILQRFGLAKLDVNRVLSYSSYVALPLNFPILGLNQALCGSANLSILHWFYCSTISLARVFHLLTHSLSFPNHFFHMKVSLLDFLQLYQLFRAQ